jgi:DNA-binding GntR family transcriptional regulator
VHRTTLYKAIRDLEKEGVLENFTRDSVRIADVTRFLEMVHK